MYQNYNMCSIDISTSFESMTALLAIVTEVNDTFCIEQALYCPLIPVYFPVLVGWHYLN